MFSFIILHYKNIKDTIECIESINNLKYDKNKINIIIVDNNSLNKDEEKVLKKYNIELLKMTENLGFAKANNFGCQFAIENYKPDFLCVINNDIEITQKDFLKKVNKLYDKHKFDILGPKINTNNGNSVNPFYAYSQIKEIKEQIRKTKKLKKIYSNVVLATCLEIGMKLKKIFKKKKIYENGNKEEVNIALHGCALIFSKKYYTNFSEIFYSQTFLYHEEEFLFYRIRKYNLLSLYSPYIEVFHKEGASLNTKFNNNLFKKKLYRYTYIEDSLTKLLGLYEKE